MTAASQSKVDLSYIEDIRNFFFNTNKFTFDGMDIFSVDVQRVRNTLEKYQTEMM